MLTKMLRAFFCYTAGKSGPKMKLKTSLALAALTGLYCNRRRVPHSATCLEQSRIYTRAELQAHNSVSTRIWVAYDGNVYDVTDFIDVHPGGSIILTAGGRDLEPFFEKYSFHKGETTIDMLAPFLIGQLAAHDRYDSTTAGEELEDEYYGDPPRDPRLIVRSAKPFNAETPLELLRDKLVTPNEVFYVRNHMPVPHCNPNQHTVTVCLHKDYLLPDYRNRKPEDFYFVQNSSNETAAPNGDDCYVCHDYDLEDLENFPQKHVYATLQCSGNRRAEMNQVQPVQGLGWEGGAIGTALWTGVSIRDVLTDCGLQMKKSEAEMNGHVHFVGADNLGGSHYETSVPLHRALDTCSLLALQMNQSQLPLDHGYPVRALLPGITGARSVKWLVKAVVTKEESRSRWQKEDYKCYPPSIQLHHKNKPQVPAIISMPVTSQICSPRDGDVVSLICNDGDDQGKIELKGYAYSGGGNSIVRVEVSTDGGKHWSSAEVQPLVTEAHQPSYSWSFWKTSVAVPAEAQNVEILCKAVDTAYNHQPESPQPIWNARGLLNNSWSRVAVRVAT